MKRFCVVVLSFLFATFATGAAAEGRSSGDFELTVWGLSKHLENPPSSRSFVEVNPGIGMREYITKRGCWEIFADANYISKNSTGGTAILAGVGGQCPVASAGRTEFLVGGVVGMARYENMWQGETSIIPGAYPFIGVRRKDITLTVGYIPHTQSGEKIAYETLFAYASIKF